MLCNLHLKIYLKIELHPSFPFAKWADEGDMR